VQFYVDDIRATVPKDVRIVAATKYFTPGEMRELYDCGIHDFGENRDDAFLEKYDALQDLDINWHFIGTLQTKKVKKVIDKIDCLHSLDRLKLAEEIDKRRTTPLDCFVQVNISEEESKHGLEPSDVPAFLKDVLALENVHVIGLMGMAAHTDDNATIHRQFQILNDLLELLSRDHGIHLNELSIGMSNDYLLALEHNATVLRLGSVLFKKEV
jgi:pyridoxal phosphate enzyme (YggS family)